MTTGERLSLAWHLAVSALLALGLGILTATKAIAKLPAERKAAVVNWLSSRPRAARWFVGLVTLGPNAAALERVLRTVATYESAGWAIAVLGLIDSKRELTLLPPEARCQDGGRPKSLAPLAVPRAVVDGRYVYAGDDVAKGER